MSVKIKIRNKKGMKDMSAYHEKKFDWSSFIIGILMTGVALFSFRTPITNLAAIVIVFAFSAIVNRYHTTNWSQSIKTLYLLSV